MKLSLILVIALTFSNFLAIAQDDAPAAEKQMAPWQTEFLNLPEKKRAEFLQHFKKSTQLFQQTRIFECIEELNEASEIFKNSPEIYNLLGACQVEFRAFDRALAYFKKALAITPDNVSVLFNIGEVQFVTKQWEQAASSFEEILATMGDDEAQMQTQRLVEFKLMLCNIKLGKVEEAKQMADKYDYFDDSPYPYYAKAALAYLDDDELAAETEIARAARIFGSSGMITPWQDTLMEFGYIKSFFGESSSQTTPETTPSAD